MVNFSRCRYAYPARASNYSGSCFTCCFKRNKLILASKKPKLKRWKVNIEDVAKAVLFSGQFIFSLQDNYWLCINMNDSFWMETCFTRPNTIISNEETEWKQFSKIVTSLIRCSLGKSHQIDQQKMQFQRTDLDPLWKWWNKCFLKSLQHSQVPFSSQSQEQDLTWTC